MPFCSRPLSWAEWTVKLDSSPLLGLSAGDICFGGVRLPNWVGSSGVTGVLLSLLLLLSDDRCFILNFLCLMYGSDEDGDVHLLEPGLCIGSKPELSAAADDEALSRM